MEKYLLTTILCTFVLLTGFVLAANESQQVDAGQDSQQTATSQKTTAQTGEYVGENGQMIKLQTQTNNRVKVESGGVSAECECQMIQEKVQEKTKLYVKLSNGNEKEVKVMPNVASEKAIERLKVHACSQESGCSIELKEVGSGSSAKLAYEVKTQKKAKILGLFEGNLQVEAQVSAENGEVLKVKKSWWAFLATEEEA